jgi:hypothetical protein
MENNNEVIFIKNFEKYVKYDYKNKFYSLYKDMYVELSKKDNFTDRFSVVTDTIENIFNLINDKKILSYSDYAVKRKKRLNHKIKNIKNIKKWKKITRRS